MIIVLNDNESQTFENSIIEEKLENDNGWRRVFAFSPAGISLDDFETIMNHNYDISSVTVKNDEGVVVMKSSRYNRIISVGVDYQPGASSAALTITLTT